MFVRSRRLEIGITVTVRVKVQIRVTIKVRVIVKVRHIDMHHSVIIRSDDAWI